MPFDEETLRQFPELAQAPQAPEIRSREEANAIAQNWDYEQENQPDGSIKVWPAGQSICRVIETSSALARSGAEAKFTEYLMQHPARKTVPLLEPDTDVSVILAYRDALLEDDTLAEE